MGGYGCEVHPHYQAGCSGCRRISAEYQRKRQQGLADGTWKRRVSTAVVWRHIETLKASGMSLAAIARTAKVSVRTVEAIRVRQTCQGPVAEAILRVVPQAQEPRRGMVPSVGVARRLQSLVAVGWSLRELARRLGMDHTHVWQWCWAKHPFITVDNAARVDALFGEIWDVPGGSVRSRNAAARYGWLPPMAWENIDDPQEDPCRGESADDVVDEVVVERALDGVRIHLTDAELVAALQVGTARGEALSAVSARLHMNHMAAKRLLNGGMTVQEAKQKAVEVALAADPGRPNAAIAREVGTSADTVRRVKLRLASAGDEAVA